MKSLADVSLKKSGQPKNHGRLTVRILTRRAPASWTQRTCPKSVQFCFMSKNKGHIHYIYQYSSAYLIPKQSQRFFQPLALLWAPTPTHSTTHTRWHLSLTLEPPSCKICLVCSWLVLDGISGWEQRSNLSWNDYNYVVSICIYTYYT